MKRSQFLALPQGVCSILLVLSLLAGALTAARPANAQGTSGSLPDPISARELQRYTQRLGLSDEQMEAAVSRHNRYSTGFARLRDGEIEQFLQEVGSLGDFRITFDREQVRKETKRAKDLMGKIQRLDDQFFDSLASLLTDSQMALLPRVKQMRQRERYRQGVPPLLATFHSAARNDLSEMIAQLNLAPDVMQPVDAELMQYETRLTALAKATYETAIDMRVTTFDRIEAQGFGEDALAEPGQAEGLLEAMFAAMDAAQHEVNQESKKIAQLNRRTLKSILPHLSADDSEQLRRMFYQTGYPGALTIHESCRRRFDTALEQGDLTDEQRQAIESLRIDHRASRDRLVEQMIDALDGQHGVMIRFNPTEEEEAEREKQAKKVEDIAEEGRQLAQRTADALDAILGREITQRVAKRVAEKEAEEEETVQVTGVMMMSVTTGGAEAGISTFTTSIDLGEVDLGGITGTRSPVPGPISHDQLMRQAHYLELDEADRTIVSTMHEDYAEQFEAVTAPQIELLRAAEDALWERDEETNERTPPTIADIDRVSALRRQVLTSAQESDAALFDDIEALLADNERAARVERMRQARRRDIYRRAIAASEGGFSFGGGGGMVVIGSGGDAREYGVDLSQLVDEMDLPRDTMRAIDPVLIEYEREVTEVFRINFEAQQAADEHMAKMSARAAREAEGGGMRSISVGGEGFEAAEAKRGEARKAKDRIVELNRATCDRLTEVLDSDAAERLRQAYDRAAFPGVFRDRLELEDKFRAALALDDLTGQQRNALLDLMAEYRETRDEVCQAMLDHHRQSDARVGEGGEFDLQTFQERMREQEKLRFQRKELGDQTIGRLRAILSDAQIAKVPGLAAETPSP